MATVQPQLDFLRVAANALADSSPSTAAFLMGEHMNIQLVNGQIRMPSSRRKFCHVCGNIFVDGKTSITRTSTTSRPRGVKKKPGSRPESTISRVCLLCCYDTTEPLSKPAKSKAKAMPVPKQQEQKPSVSETKKSKPNEPVQPKAVPKPEPAPVPSTADSRKKRAKARKAGGGLQALVAQNKTSSNTPTPSSTKPSTPASDNSGLDFFDFFKPM